MFPARMSRVQVTYGASEHTFRRGELGLFLYFSMARWNASASRLPQGPVLFINMRFTVFTPTSTRQLLWGKATMDRRWLNPKSFRNWRVTLAVNSGPLTVLSSSQMLQVTYIRWAQACNQSLCSTNSNLNYAPLRVSGSLAVAYQGRWQWLALLGPMRQPWGWKRQQALQQAQRHRCCLRGNGAQIYGYQPGRSCEGCWGRRRRQESCAAAISSGSLIWWGH